MLSIFAIAATKRYATSWLSAAESPAPASERQANNERHSVSEQSLSPVRAPNSTALALHRSLTLTHATLYGPGVTIGAGIYVLVGAAVARAEMHAPLAFSPPV